MKRCLAIVLPVLLCLLSGCGNRTVEEGSYYAIDHFFIEEEGDALRDSMAALTVDTFRWYQSMEGEDGVYLIHAEHYPKELLQEWADYGVYQTVPQQDIWYFTVSENYLRDRGLSLSDSQREAIGEGVRLYLLPDSLPEEEAACIRAFLTEDALLGLDQPSLIDTPFSRDRKIAFDTYSWDGTLETADEGEIAHPVIFAASCANMKHFESESLIATGKENSYIKLSPAAFAKYAGEALPDGLKENKVTFLPLEKINN